MNKIIDEFRLFVCEKMLFLILIIVPKNQEGIRLVQMIYDYGIEYLERYNDGGVKE